MLTYKLLAAILPLCYIIISYLEVILGPPHGYPPFLLMLELLTWEPLLVTQCWAEMIWTWCSVRGFTEHVSVNTISQNTIYFCPHCRFVSWQKSPKSQFQQKLIFSIWDINFSFIKVLINYSGALERPELLINYQLLGY